MNYINLKKLFYFFFGIILFLPILAGVFFIPNIRPVYAAGDNWETGYTYRKEIVFTSSTVKIPSTQTDFPVLVSFTDSDLKTVDNDGDVQNSSGYDIKFTSSDGSTDLDHQIEKYDSTTGEYVSWVRMPYLLASSTIYIYYGNSDISLDPSTTTVWDANYKMVQHLNETTGTHNDSTSVNNDGTTYFTATTNQDAEGKIAGADTFDGTDDYIDAGSADSLNFSYPLTLETWVNPDARDNFRLIIISGTNHSNGAYGFGIYGTSLRAELYTAVSRNIWYWGTIGDSDLGQWMHITLTFDGTTAQGYVNGVAKTTTKSYDGVVTPVFDKVQIGNGLDKSFFDGLIDEVRISNVVRSANWITTEYANQNDPDNFYSVGAEQTTIVISETFPEAPSALSATAGDSQISLSWTVPGNNGSAITDYVVEYKLTSASSWTTFGDGVSTNANSTVTGLTNGLNYTFRVSAVNANGTGPVSGTTTGTPVTTTQTAPYATSVTISGTAVTNQILTGSYSYIDPNEDSEGTSLFRWLRADTYSGSYTAISNATNSTYTITSSDSGKYIKFEVTPVSAIAPTTGSAVLSSATGQIGSSVGINHILSTGQSLAAGSKGTPVLTLTQPYSNVMFSGVSWVPLVESSVETISSAMANLITSKVSGNDYQIAVSRHAVGGTAYSGLKKDTWPYLNGMAQVNAAKSATEALGKTYRVVAVTNIHGESDHIAGNSANYEGYLVEWQNDYENDVKAITGQTVSIPMFTDQMSSQTSCSSATSGIPIAQLSAYENNPTKIILVGPKYFFNYADGLHLTNTSYRWLGEYYGKVMKKVLIDGDVWQPLMPREIVQNANIIYARFYVPASPIVFDTTLVSERTNYGFEYYDNSSSASISSVEILDSETVKVTLNTTPTGGDQRLRYAYTGTSGAWAGAQIAGSAAGNLRDSDSTTSLYENTLYNWAVHFDKAITADTTAPVISNVTITADLSTATVSWSSDENSSSVIDYGLTSSYGNSTTESDTPARVSSHSQSLSNLSSCTTYHYRVRSKDLAQNEGVSSDSTFTTSGCAGGGLPAQSYYSPVSTEKGISVSIDNGAQFTNTSTVNLTLFGGSNAKRMAISNLVDFSGAIQEEYQLTKEWNLCDGLVTCSEGEHTVYVKFFASWGKSSEVITNKIFYKKDTLDIKPTLSEVKPKVCLPYLTSYIKYGADNNQEEVKKLLIFLNDYEKETLDIKVIYDRNSIEAVKKFQKKYAKDILAPWGISTPTGLVYKTTINKINEIYCQSSSSEYQNTLSDKITIADAITNNTISNVNTSQDFFSAVFIKNLYLGIYSEDVKRLQKLLATKPEIYPEKLVTGYFGLLTEKAVQAFQLKYNVVNSKSDAGLGVVGPKTRVRLKEVFESIN